MPRVYIFIDAMFTLADAMFTFSLMPCVYILANAMCLHFSKCHV